MRSLLALLLVLAAVPAAADVVHLANGSKLTGEVVGEERGGVRFRAGEGIEAVIPRREILRIDRGPVPESQRRRRPGRDWDEGHAGSCPLTCERCDGLFARSLSRLCAAAERGGRIAPLSALYGGWPPLQITTVSVLGLVLLGEGNTTVEGPHADTLRRIAAYLDRVGVADHPSMEQYRSWILAFTGLFLAELTRVEPDEARRARLEEIARLLASGLKGTRGWCHGLKARGDGYGPFTAVSIWCVAALDAIRDRGVEVDAKALGAGVAVLRRSLGKRGVGARYYADRWTTISPGRTGGVLWALIDHGGAKPEGLGRARDFLLDTLWAVPDGHASGMMNLAWGALGADALGRDARDRFFKTHRRTVLAHRESSGLFAPQRWSDLGFFEDNLKKAPFAGTGTTWPDHAYGKAWATAWMLLTWQLGRGKSVL